MGAVVQLGQYWWRSEVENRRQASYEAPAKSEQVMVWLLGESASDLDVFEDAERVGDEHGH